MERKVFYREKIFQNFPMGRIHSKVFYGEKALQRSSMERRPCKGLLWRESPSRVFYRGKTLQKSSMDRSFLEVSIGENLL